MRKFIKSKKMWFAFITVFVSGILIGFVFGIGATVYIGMKRHKPGFMHVRLLGYMNRELNLSPEQKIEAEKIMTRMSKQLGEIRREQYPTVKNIISTAFSDIEEILDEEQKVKFKKIYIRMKKWRSKRHGHIRKGKGETETKEKENTP